MGVARSARDDPRTGPGGTDERARKVMGFTQFGYATVVGDAATSTLGMGMLRVPDPAAVPSLATSMGSLVEKTRNLHVGSDTRIWSETSGPCSTGCSVTVAPSSQVSSITVSNVIWLKSPAASVQVM